MAYIEKIESYILSHDLKEPFYFSQWVYDQRTVCLVKITARDGVTGWGEGYGPAELVAAGIRFFSPLLIGENALAQETLWQRMYLRSLDYARRGVLLSALSALDIALWDIKGKVLQLPVSVLLGGRKREYVHPYATGLYFSEGANLPERLSEEALRYKEQGFQAIKMKVGLGKAIDLAHVKAVREAIGPTIQLMIDANHAYSLTEALQLARQLEPYDIGWFEEPVSPEEYHSYCYLRAQTAIPIAGGECEYLRSGFLQLFQNQCVDIAQPDICAAGGLTEVKKIACMAQTFGVQVIPHTWGTGIAISAALHLLSNWDTVPGRLHEAVPLIELDQTENRLRDEAVMTQYPLKEGRLQVPDLPGLGITVDEKALDKYAVAKS